ncbi:MAG: hypothetical protein V4850_03235 [Myxococcota bacterium]
MLALTALALVSPVHAADGVVTGVVTPLEADRRRIRAHLAEVEADLRAAPVDTLDADQRARRDASLDTLHSYWLAGEFPHNVEAPAERVPVFRDADGRDCAVGALIRASGEGALADTIDARWHLARVPTMDEPDLLVWAVAQGFKVDELARIQPSYCMCEDDDGYAPVCGADGVTYWNTCAAETCAGSDVVSQGACPFEREVCPDYEATEPPAVTVCDEMWEICGPEAVYDTTTWADWLAGQDQACLESVDGPFDGPDAPPVDEQAPPDEAAAGCSTSGAGWSALATLVAGMLTIRRRR